MTRQQEFRKQTEEAKFEAFSLMCEKVAGLEKENAELKKKNLAYKDAVDMQMYTNKANKEIANRKLTKAKEIIREMMKYEINEYDGSLEIHFEELKKQAEQFLKEIEK